MVAFSQITLKKLKRPLPRCTRISIYGVGARNMAAQKVHGGIPPSVATHNGIQAAAAGPRAEQQPVQQTPPAIGPANPC